MAEVGKCLMGWKFKVPREIGEGAEHAKPCFQRLPGSGLLQCESPPFPDTGMGRYVTGSCWLSIQQ